MRLLERSGAATFTTYAGRGIVPDDAPLHFGAMLARAGSADVMAQADLVVAIGTRLSEVDLWRSQLGHKTAMLRVDIDPEVLAETGGLQIPVRADAMDFVTRVGDALDEGGSDWDAKDVADTRARWRSEIDAINAFRLRQIREAEIDERRLRELAELREVSVALRALNALVERTVDGDPSVSELEEWSRYGLEEVG